MKSKKQINFSLDELVKIMEKTTNEYIENQYKLKEWEIYKTKLDEYHHEQSKKYIKKNFKYKGECYCNICILNLIS